MIGNLFKKNSNETTGTGVCVPPNTFAHTVKDTLSESAADDLSVSMPIIEHEDINLGGDPFDAVQLGRTSRQTWHETEAEQYTPLDGLFHVSTLGGTGLLAHRAAGVPHDVDPSVDVVDVLVGSDNVAQTRQAQTTVPQTIAYPFIDPGTVLLSNRAPEMNKQNVTEEVSYLIATLAREDLADLQHYVYSGFYDRIAVGDYERTKADFARLMTDRVGDDPWFDPQDWYWWNDETATIDDVVDEQEQRAIAVVPPGYEDLTLDGYNIDMTTVPADVDAIHFVVLVKLDSGWVDALQNDGIDWLRDRIGEGNNRYADVWEGLVARRWSDDPVERFEYLQGRLDT